GPSCKGKGAGRYKQAGIPTCTLSQGYDRECRCHKLSLVPGPAASGEKRTWIIFIQPYLGDRSSSPSRHPRMASLRAARLTVIAAPPPVHHHDRRTSTWIRMVQALSDRLEHHSSFLLELERDVSAFPNCPA